MNQRTLYLRVGGLLIFSLAMLFGLVLLLTGDRWHAGHPYETYFRESVQGLEVGAPVKFRGVTLGRVTNIGLVSAVYGATAEEQVMDPTYRLIVVRFKVDPKRVGKLPDNDVAVKSGLRAKLANQGLTGVMYLELDFLAPDRFPPQAVPWTPLDDYVPSVPSTIAQVQDLVTQVLDNARKIDFERVGRNLDGLITDARSALGDHGDLHATLLTAQTTIRDLQARIDAADLPALAAALRRTGGAITGLADGPQTRAVLNSTQVALNKLPPLIASLQQTANRASGGLADTQAELIPILEDVRAAVQNLRETTEGLRRDPGAVLQQGPPPGAPASVTGK
jgi:ABC-type transporter Mla subunit MlaD